MKHKLESTIRGWFFKKSFGLYMPGATEASRTLEVGATYVIRAFASRQPVAIPSVAQWNQDRLKDVISIRCLERGAIEFLLRDKTVTTELTPTSVRLDRELVLRDDLEFVYRIGADLHLALNKAGITRFEQIARWTDDDVRHFGNRLGGTGLIKQHQWIEQCAILARGEETPHARQRRLEKARGL